MSLSTLAANLSAEAPSGKVTISLATLQAAGLTARTDLDTVIADAFGWPAGTPLTLTAPLTVGSASDTALTASGTLSALEVSGLATVQFSASGSAVTFTVTLPLGTWGFTTSFPVMAGFPFDQLELQGPAFLFSSDGATVTYGKESIVLTAGLNVAGNLAIPKAFASLLTLLESRPSNPLVLHGPVDPSVMVADGLPKPDVHMMAALATGPLPKLGFLQLEGADLVVDATTQETLNGKAQYTDAALSTTLDFGEGEPKLDCRISVQANNGELNLLLQPDEDALQPTLDALFRAMGGRSWYAVVPTPLQSLFTSFALKGLRSTITVVSGKPRLASIGMSVGTTQTWKVFDGLEIGELDFGWDIDDPLGDAAVTAQFTGECQFLSSVFPGVFYVAVTSDLDISAEYVGDAKLSTLLSGGSSVAAAQHPFDFDLLSVAVDFDVPRKAFSLTADASASLDVIGDGSLNVEDIHVSFAKAPNNLTAGLNALVLVGGVPLFLDAEYANGGWHFAGGIAPGGSVDLGDLVAQLCEGLDLPTDFVPDSLTLKPLQLTLDVPAGATPASWSIDAGVQWVFSAGALQNMEIDAAVDLVYDGAAKAYSGKLSGEAKLPLPFGTIDVVLGYAFKPGSKDLLVEWKGFAKATYSFTDDTIVFQLEVRSLGDMLAEIVRVVEDDPDFQLPPPWDLLNQIVLKDFTVTWRLKPKAGESAISLTYDMTGNEIKLFFVEIRSITLSEVGGKIMVGLDLKFLTDSDFKEQQWPAQNPTPPPGQSTSLFELDLLALGQHVTVVGLDQVTDVDGAVKLLESFTPPDGTSVPVKPDPPTGQPTYAPGSRWLVGTRFKVLVDTSVKPPKALLDLEAIFNDPQLYGLKITLGGAKAGIFGGLSFEILYRKVSDTVGVYEIELTLPDWARHLEFGEVSVTLPIVGVDIYTNGDFRVDFGFPANMDFSRSFAIQAFPFTGAGGFYFGVLSSATATNLPQTTKGTFDPVIVFGVGLQLGLGKSIDEGIFSAQLTVNVFGIVEGVVAPWHPNSTALVAAGDTTAFDDAYYYWLQGTIGIVGKLVGSVNFAIISADVSVTVQAFVQMTIEAHRAIPIHLEAGVSVQITLKIDLGLFSIKIHLSFSLTVKADFQIGSPSHAPWDPDGVAAAPKAASLLAAPHAAVQLPARTFRALAVEEKLPLTVYAAPHLTLADWTSGAPSAAYVVSLFVDGPIGRKPGDAPSDFEVLARETLLWAITNFGTDDAATLTPAEAAAGDVSADQITTALSHFTATGPPPVAYSDLRTFLSTHFTLTVTQPAAGTEIASAVALPMLPDLVLGVPAWGGQAAQSVDFSSAATCTPAYLKNLQDLLGELAVDLETPLQQQYAGMPPKIRSGDLPTQSLATFVFEDLFALMCRHMLQAAADSFGSYPYKLTGTESLDAVMAAFDSANDLTAAALGDANAGLALTTGTPLTLNGVQHQVKAGESLNGISAAYGAVGPLAIATANQGLEGLLAAGTTITVGSTPHTIGGRDTFATIAAATTGKLADVVTAVGALTDVLVPLALVAVPPFTYKTAEKDTLGTVAAAFGVPVAQLATDNAGVGSLFATKPGQDTFAVVPGLSVLTAAELGEVLHDANVYANLAGITTRFLLNGLRLPVTSDITLPPGSPCAGCTDCGMQALIGQQVTLPTLVAGDAFSLTMSAGANGGWITFPSGSSISLPIDNQATSSRSGQIDWINAVLAAAGAALTPDTTSIAALPETHGVVRRFVLPHATPLQAAAPLTLPVGTASARPTAFALPDGLLALLAEPTSVRPAFSLQLAEPAPSGGGVTLTAAQAHGWATLVGVTVKRPAGGDGTPMWPGTYELVGTDPTGIVALERLLQAGTAPVFFQLLFPPNASAPASAGLQLDDPATVSTFIVQANLSTATAPQGGGLMSDVAVEEAEPRVTPDAASFVRLLWECSIVQSGGYSLYYESAPGSPGLPEHLFDATGSAQLQLLVLHADGADGLGSYVNAAVVGDAVDPSRTSVLAQSEARTVTVPAASGAALATLAADLHLTASELAIELAGQPLQQGAIVQIAGGVYETRSGDTLGALAARFGTSGPAIESANSGAQIDWSAIPAWTVLRLPPTSLTVADTTTTLAAVAERFVVSVAALGVLNATAPLLAQATLTITDQLVDATAVLPPGVGGFAVTRKQLAGDPSDPAVYLDGTFHLLGYQLAENLGFTGGPSGLPVGPGDPIGDEQLQQVVLDAPAPANDAGTLLYEHLLPLAANAKVNGLVPPSGTVPPASANPYAGVGAVAQPRLEWRDLFGNRARTALSDPTVDPSGPQNLPPIPVEYTDALLGVGQWPSVSAGYGVTAGSPPTLDIGLRFEASRYAGAGSAGPAQQAALADMQTLARAYYQLNQCHPDGTPHVTIVFASSLDGGTPHVLAGADDAKVRGLVLEAWQYLKGVVAGTVTPRTDPIVATVSVPVAATNAADIFELTVSLTLARDPSLVAAASRDEHGVVDAALAVSPLLGDPASKTGTASLAAFASAFEQAYAAGDVVLKIGVGDSREGAAGTAEARLLWGVRTSASPQQGAIGCEVTGPPVFWAPPPLSQVPVSRNDVEIWPFDPDKGLDPSAPDHMSYTGVDLDVWARQALSAIDALLSPRYDVPGFVLDSRGSTTYLDRLRAAKTSLAASIAGTVQGVLTTPPAPTDQAAIADAQDKWEQQLLVTLSSAYTVDVAVQLPVTVSRASDGRYEAPALYGHPIVAAPKDEAAGTPSAPPYSLSTFKVAAVDGPSHLTFLFTANDPSDQAYTVLDLGYQVDQIEHQIGKIDGIDGYKASTWLTFPTALPELALSDPELATVQVPIVLRAYPDAPRLTAQRSEQTLDHANAQTLLRSATAWSYVAEYAEQHVAQDVTQATATFNVAPPKPDLALAREKDLFPPLARLIAVLPELQAVFDADLVQLATATDPSTPQFTRAAHAVAAFTTLVEDVAANWAPVPPTAGPGVAVANGTELTFTIAETRYPAPSEQHPDGGDELLVTITPDPSTPLPVGVPMPALVFEGYETVPTGAGVRYQDPKTQDFLQWETARTTPGRSVVTGPLAVLGVENAQLGVRLVRNAALVPGNPTLHPFVYRTPLVTFTSPYTPLLSVGDAIDVAAIATGTSAARPLVEQLQAMFAAFFAAAPAGTQETVQLQVGYRYELASGLPAGSLPPVDVPIALVPSAAFTVPDDWSPGAPCPNPPTEGSPFVCRVAQVIRQWVSDNQPTADAELTFDLAAFSTLSSSSLPLVRLSGMTLRRADVTDL
jgi:LysM repeat protein